MAEVKNRIGDLSPEQLNLLELHLKQRRVKGQADEPILDTGVGPWRLSFAQERIWLLDKLEPASAAYNVGWALRLKGVLDVSALQKALDAVVARHETLRTVVQDVEGTPFQLVEAPRPVELHLIDATEETSCGLLSEQARRRFNLSSDLMIRATLLRLRAEEHILLLVLHHISADGWSRSILLRELGEFYAVFTGNRALSLPDLPVTYKGFAQWQRRWLELGPLDAQLAYWKKQLRDAPSILNLPLDKARPSAQSYEGAVEVRCLGDDLVRGLRALGKEENATLYMVLLAAFQVLLYRYIGESDIVVGTPIASRKRVETENLIGLFLNTLAIRTDLSGEPTFRELLGRVRAVTVAAYDNQDVPFEKLIDALKPPRDRSHNPIFQVLFVLLNAPRDVFAAEELSAETVEFDTGTSQFDLVMEIAERPSELAVRLAYCTDLFVPATARRMLGHYQTLLRAAAQNPDVAISKLPLLTDAEKQTLLVDWNQTAAEYPESCTHELFQAMAARAPDAVAAVSGTRQWTYAELSRESDRLACHLRERGVGPGVLVAVFVERSLEMLAGLLAIWKTGAAYLPLDPAYPKQRIAFILEDAEPAVVLTDQALRAGLPESAAKIVVLEELCGVAGEAPVAASLDSLAYVIYTSGSTGKPKGVAIRHRSLTNLLHSMARQLDPAPTDVFLAMTTIAFDIAGLELFLPLMSGARVAMVGREIASDGLQLAKIVEELGVTIMQATPATWQMLLDSGWTPRESMKIVCGGEALPASIAERLRKGGRLWNVYGPTETTIWSTAAHLKANEDLVTIGRPLNNTEIYVLDRERQPVPVGVAGELYIGGVGLAQGYWKRPELTEERFVPHPFLPGARLYRTGDSVRYLPDGNIEFLGRMDNQVKIRGFRIELAEIESVLGRHEAVGLCVVIVRENASGDKILVAFFESKAQLVPSAADLREHLRQELPDYMVPSSFVHMERLPLTTSGKIDRKALPVHGQPQIEAHHSLVLPRDPLERALAQVWAKVLNVKQVGLHDDFFELGGHSLAAVRLLFEVQKATGKTLPLATLFQASSVGALANILRQEGWTPSWSSLVPIQPLGSKHPLFLVHGAEGNLLLYRQLSRHLGLDQPVYGLQSQGLNGDVPQSTTVEKMAGHYVKEIMAVQPTGPYYLGGYCLGGLIAFEMAQQLTALGEKVELVVMLETYISGAVNSSKVPFQGAVHSTQNLWFHFANAASLGASGCRNFLREKVDIELTRLKMMLSPSTHPHYSRVTMVNDEAAEKYRPKPYAGRVAVIRPKAYFSGFSDPSFGWSESVPNALEVHVLPFYPKGMLIEPFCRVLAHTIAKCLHEVR